MDERYSHYSHARIIAVVREDSLFIPPAFGRLLKIKAEPGSLKCENYMIGPWMRN